MPTRQQALAAFQEYIGDITQGFDLFEDPKVRGCWAGRRKDDQGHDGIIEGFLIQNEPTSVLGTEGVEEVEWESWPPKSGNLRFFI